MSYRDRSRSPPDRFRGRKKFQIIIKNLPFSVNWKRLKELIKDEVGDVKFANVVEHNGRSAGFGFAEFGNERDMRKAIQNMHRTQIDGRDIHVFEDAEERELQKLKEQKGISNGGGGGFQGGPRGGQMDDRRPPVGRPSGEPPTLNGTPIPAIPGVSLDDLTLSCLGNGPVGSSVFVHNLLFEITEQRLRDVFSLAGTVTTIDMPKSGYAVVTFSKPIEAIKSVILFINQDLCGRKIMIKIDSQKDVRGGKPRDDDRQRSSYGSDSNRSDPPYNQRNTQYNPSGDRDRAPRRPSPARGQSPPPREPYQNRGPPGPITRWDNTAEPPPPPPPVADDSWRYNRGPPPPVNRGPPLPVNRGPPIGPMAPPPDLHRPPQNGGPSRKTIQIENLPLNVTTQTIRELFERIGDVDYVQLSDGGRCELLFFNEFDAQTSIEKFDKFYIENREIRVFNAVS